MMGGPVDPNSFVQTELRKEVRWLSLGRDNVIICARDLIIWSIDSRGY